MPEMVFEIQWPDGSHQAYYSPSLIVEEYLEPGQEYPVEDFVGRCRESLTIAGERVLATYGFRCAQSAISVAEIERAAAGFAEGAVKVQRFGR